MEKEEGRYFKYGVCGKIVQYWTKENFKVWPNITWTLEAKARPEVFRCLTRYPGSTMVRASIIARVGNLRESVIQRSLKECKIQNNSISISSG